jgi:hypothetical protein
MTTTDVASFCSSADLAKAKGHSFVLKLCRCVGFEEDEMKKIEG